jgi:hypothetical protein
VFRDNANLSAHADLWVSIETWLHDVDQVDQANPWLRECVADVAAAVRDVPKDALVGEHTRRHRRTMRLARGAVTALALLLVVASVAAVLAVLRGNDAVDAQHLSSARGMVGQAAALRDRDPAAALRFGIAAQTVDPSPLTRASLAESLLAGPYRATLPATAAVTSMAVTPDGRFAAVGALDGSVQVWDPAAPGRPRVLGSPGTGLTLLDLVPLADLRADPLQTACARVGTSLARETWAFYAPDVEYRDASANG